MKIFAVIHNYGPACPDSPMGEGAAGWYTMPDSAIMHTGNPLFVPVGDGARPEAFASVAWRCERLGKSIPARFAGRYLKAVAAAFAIVDSALLPRLREAGLPWSEATASDRACVVGNFQPISTLVYNRGFRVTCGSSAFDYDPALIRRPVESLLPRISDSVTLKTGDIILAALTPRGIPLEPGSRLTATDIQTETNLIDINIR